MAWHVVHNLLEQCRKISTFPGKLWVMVMFAFRMVMVARVGDQVYSDEQEYFYCNTNTPGCNQVCFSHFSPISHLRFWSVMVIVTATPPIMFFAYASHIITRAARKKEEREYMKIRQKGLKEKLQPKVKSHTAKYIKHVRKRNKAKENLLKSPDDKMLTGHAEDPLFENKYPIYDKKFNVLEMEKAPTPPLMENPHQREILTRFAALNHPEISRAYWWQVMIRTIIEAGFLWLQFYLFGFEVPMVYNCHARPCPTVTECWVSRAYEKTIFLYFMFIIGSASFFLGILEFWSLGWVRLRVALGCNTRTKFQKKSGRKPSLTRIEHLSNIDMERFSVCSLGNSGSSGSTMSSV